MDWHSFSNILIILTFFKPITIPIVFSLIFIVLLLMCSGLISASEMAFFSLDPETIDQQKNINQKLSTRIQKLISIPQKLLATLLILNNLVNVTVVILATYVTYNFFDFSGNHLLAFLFEFVIVTSLILLFGEMMPKIYANKYPFSIAKIMAGPLLFLVQLLHPLSTLMVRSTRMIEHRLAKKKKEFSLDDLSQAIDITTDDKAHQQEKKILKRIVKFADIDVSGVMKPRIDIYSVNYNTSFLDLLTIIKEAGFSRLPVYKENLDQVVGILHIKDLLSLLDKDVETHWQQNIRPAIFVPENKKINDLLTEFKEKKLHMAVVVDEYGGTSGLVTLEDILEEIVGEINDEYDVESENVNYKKIDAQTYIFEGKTSLNDLYKITAIDDNFFDEIQGEAESLGGVLLEICKKIPETGKKIQYRNIDFFIESADNRRIKKVKLVINPDTNDENE
jgi:gliding motility-associated protein GldE